MDWKNRKNVECQGNEEGTNKLKFERARILPEFCQHVWAHSIVKFNWVLVSRWRKERGTNLAPFPPCLLKISWDNAQPSSSQASLATPRRLPASEYLHTRVSLSIIRKQRNENGKRNFFRIGRIWRLAHWRENLTDFRQTVNYENVDEIFGSASKIFTMTECL